MAQPKARRFEQLGAFGVDQIAETLASAFSHDPLMMFLLGDEVKEEHEERLRPMFYWCVREIVSKPNDKAFLYASHDKLSAALWVRHDAIEPNFFSKWSGMVSFFSCFRRRLPAAIQSFTVFEKQRPLGAYMYLWIIGTHQDCQSKGRGSSVMVDVLKICDSEGLPAYLESSNPLNRNFYKKFGFEIIEPMTGLPEGCPPIDRMLRKPRNVDNDQTWLAF